MRISSAVAVGSALLAASLASADVSRNVISAFRGQIVITKDDLPEGKNDAETIKKIKAANLSTLEGNGDAENATWHFHYTAFLLKGGASDLKLEFMKDGKLSADKRLEGVDPKQNVLTGDISIDENEGLAKGKTYTIELSQGSTVVAKTTLTMK